MTSQQNELKRAFELAIVAYETLSALDTCTPDPRVQCDFVYALDGLDAQHGEAIFDTIRNDETLMPLFTILEENEYIDREAGRLIDPPSENAADFMALLDVFERSAALVFEAGDLSGDMGVIDITKQIVQGFRAEDARDYADEFTQENCPNLARFYL